MSNFDDYLNRVSFPPPLGWQPRPRILLAPLHAEHVDLRMHVCPGDEVMVNAMWSIVREVKLWRHPRRPNRNIPVRPGWDAVEIKTDSGSRWFGYPPRSLPTKPVSRKRPLW